MHLPQKQFTFLQLWANYDVICGDIYGVVDEIITRKFKASLEPFWDLKIHLFRVTYECIQRQAVCLFLWYTYGWSRSLGLHNPCTNKSSQCHALLYIRAVHATINLHCAVEYVPVHQGLPLSRLRVDLSQSATKASKVDHAVDLLPHYPFTIQLLGMWSSFSYHTILD